MRDVRNGRDKGVSEIIGTVLLFGIFITLLSSITLWYVPSTETSYENTYQSETAASMASIASTFNNPDLPPGLTVTDNLPMGISGGFLLPSQSTQVNFNPSEFSGSVSYGVGISYKYTGPHPTSSILNKLLETFPSDNFSNPQAELYDQYNGLLYVAGYASNNIAVINVVTGQILKLIFAGSNPASITLDPSNGYLYVADYSLFYSPSGYSYSTVSIINTHTNTYVKSIDLYNNNGESEYSSSSIVYDASTGYIYVFSNQTNYYFAMINPNNDAVSFILFLPFLTPFSFSSVNIPIIVDNSQGNFILLPLNLSFTGSPEFIIIDAANPGSQELIDVNGNSLDGNILYGATYSGNYIYFTYFGGNDYGGIISVTFPTFTPNSFPSFNYASEYANPNSEYTPYNISLQQDTGNIIFSMLNINGKSSDSKIDALAPSTMSVSHSIKVVGNAGQIQFDSNHVIVPDSSANYETVLLIGASSISIDGLILDSPFQSPVGSIYNPDNGYLYVSNPGSGTVTVISPINDSLVARINTGALTAPSQMAFSSANDHIYLIYTHSNRIGIISNYSFLGDISLSYGGSNYFATSISFDPVTGFIDISANSNSNGGFFSVNTNLPFDDESATLIALEPAGSAEAVSYDGYAGLSYGIYKTNGNVYLLNISNTHSIQLSGISNAVTGAVFDSLDGYLYLAIGSQDVLAVYTQNFIYFSQIYTGSQPEFPIYDPGNNIIYVSNYGTSNITVVSGESNTVLITVWVGNGPSGSSFDPSNGYIYIPDQQSDRVSVINGGFTFFFGRPGIFYNDHEVFGGELQSYGYTEYIPSVSYVFAGGALMELTSNYRSASILTHTPFTVENLSGHLYLSGIFINMTGDPSSVSASSPQPVSFNIGSKISNVSYVGQEFYVSDLYNNKYQAIVTSVYLEYYTLKLNTTFAEAWDNSLYSEYNGTSSSAPPVWYFNNIPMKVSLNGNTITVSLLHPVNIYSVSLTYYKVYVGI
ncbi:MAG: hypothetical protein M1454_05775 [Candidatus Thermoplasmatota archaeon]|nr:hypothetical protein [Candidatus Thermoplasmatota archaeon]MCL5730824.1 hypothetical protein [Candidatus Thermoplasmatota archaeon]